MTTRNSESSWTGRAAAGYYLPVVTAGVLSTPGGRGADKMEDRFLLASPVGEPGTHLLGVFDGHRGAEAAEFAAGAVARCMQARWGGDNGLGPEASLAATFVAVDAAFKELDDARRRRPLLRPALAGCACVDHSPRPAARSLGCARLHA